jgi:hypothetical protein
MPLDDVLGHREPIGAPPTADDLADDEFSPFKGRHSHGQRGHVSTFTWPRMSATGAG